MKKFLPIFFFLILSSSFFAGKALAANAVPKGAPIPCKDTSDTEFNSDRPYQASPCGSRPITYWCGNKVVVDVGNVKGPSWQGDSPPSGCTNDACTVDLTKNFGNIVIDLTNVQLPILGNTQQILNSQNTGSQMDDATRMNDYVSAYLNGTQNQAEYGPADLSKVVDFSGPLKKLLPGAIQDAQRINTIKSATEIAPASTDDTAVTPTQIPAAPENHNQIVVCGKSNLGIIGDFFHIGSVTPTNCYNNDGTPAQGQIFRLVKDRGGFVGATPSSGNPDPCSFVCRVPGSVECKRCQGQGLDTLVGGSDGWDGPLSFWDSIVNDLIQKVTSLLPNVAAQVIRDSIGNHWNYKIPPLPWDKDPFTGLPMTALEYQKYYNEWRGKTCVIIPVFNQIVCLDSILVPNKYADLYPYIPLSNTVDKKGAQMVTAVVPTANQADVELAKPVGYVLKYSPVLYIPHALESYSLSNQLVSTYGPQEILKMFSGGKSGGPIGGAITTSDVENNNNTDTCRIIDSRTNAGDDVTFDNPKSQIEVDDFTVHVTRIDCTTTTNEKCLQMDPTYDHCLPGMNVSVPYHTCKSEIYATIPSISKNPYADDIWQNTVAGSNSVFRRIYPKTGDDAPVSCIADTPAVSPVTYTIGAGSAAGIGITKVIEPDKSVTKADNPKGSSSLDAQLYYPHYGGVLDYFLNGIQTALRPQGYGEPTPQNGRYCSPTVPKECTVNVPDSAVPAKYLGVFKANYIDLANRMTTDCPGEQLNLATQCYNYVVTTAQKAGVNPAFALTIWLNESGASNYCHGGPTTQDFGINLPSLYKNTTGQLDAFLNMAKMKLCSGMAGFPETMAGWLSRFQSSAGVCNPADVTAMNYYQDVRDTTWTWVAGCVKNGKFGIAWPTDMSCP